MPRHPHHPAYDDAVQPPYRLFMYVLMLVIAAAFSGFIWNWYSGSSEAPVIRAPAAEYKVAPSDDRTVTPDAMELGASVQGPGDTASPASPPAPERAAPGGPPVLSASPNLVGNGPYVAQLAALQSEESVDPAWRRFASRAPELFARAQLDVERADLGARGIYYRVRAGYFADRENASRFCDRIRQMGQDCIVVAR